LFILLQNFKAWSDLSYVECLRFQSSQVYFLSVVLVTAPRRNHQRFQTRCYPQRREGTPVACDELLPTYSRYLSLYVFAEERNGIRCQNRHGASSDGRHASYTTTDTRQDKNAEVLLALRRPDIHNHPPTNGWAVQIIASFRIFNLYENHNSFFLASVHSTAMETHTVFQLQIKVSTL